MAKLLSEISYQDEVYTITDLNAQKALKTKADLVNGLLVSTQLPKTVITQTVLNDSLQPLQQDITTVKNTLKDKADIAAIASFTTRSDVELMINASHTNFITTVKLTEQLKPYSTTADVQKGLDQVLSDAKEYTDQQLADFDGPTEGGVSDYNDLTNIPTINNITVQGNLSLTQLGINIPTHLSSLQNDMGFITTFPTNLSEFNNDAGFVTSIPTNLSDFTNDVGFITKAPTKLSELVNDAGFITEIPTNLSAFNNDAGFITEIPAEQDPVWTAEKDLYATKEYTLALIQNITIVTQRKPVTINKPASNRVTLDISFFPYAVISGFTITTVEGELFIPLYSDQGISKILKHKAPDTEYPEKTKTFLTLTLSDTLINQEWSTGFVYFGQFLDTGNSSDTYYITADSILFLVDENADGNPSTDSTTQTLLINSDQHTLVNITDQGILEIRN